MKDPLTFWWLLFLTGAAAQPNPTGFWLLVAAFDWLAITICMMISIWRLARS